MRKHWTKWLGYENKVVRQNQKCRPSSPPPPPPCPPAPRDYLLLCQSQQRCRRSPQREWSCCPPWCRTRSHLCRQWIRCWSSPAKAPEDWHDSLPPPPPAPLKKCISAVTYRERLFVVRHFGSDGIRFVAEVSQTRAQGLCAAVPANTICRVTVVVSAGAGSVIFIGKIKKCDLFQTIRISWKKKKISRDLLPISDDMVGFGRLW